MRRSANWISCLALLAASTVSGGDDTKPAPKGGTAELDGGGIHRSGRWKYRNVVTSEGSKSQGREGQLFYDCIAVPRFPEGGSYETPWGRMVLREAERAWDQDGWVLGAPSALGEGHVPVPPPGAGDPEPVVSATLFRDLETTAEGEQIRIIAEGVKLEAWALEQLRLVEVGAPWHFQEQIRITDQAVTIHDTKLSGRVTARLAYPRESDTLTVLIDGTSPAKVSLARRDGATGVACPKLSDHLGNESRFILVFQVECAAPEWPKPVMVGVDADGKTIAVRGTSRVLVVLPGEAQSGLVWTASGVEGGSVKALGEAQFTPDPDAKGPSRSGTFELLYRVVAKGRATLVLELRRPWQTDVPATRVFRVVVDVQETFTPAGGR